MKLVENAVEATNEGFKYLRWWLFETEPGIFEPVESVRHLMSEWGQLDMVFANAGVNGVWAPIDEAVSGVGRCGSGYENRSVDNGAMSLLMG